MSAATHNTVCVLPWLDLKNDLQIGRFHFLRWPSIRSLHSNYIADIDKILSIYKTMLGEPRDNPTILVETVPSAFPTLDDDTQDYAKAVTLLTLAVLSTNEYCKQGVCPANATCFETYFHNFTPGSDWLSLSARRRDGRQTVSGYKYGDVVLSEPQQCAFLGGLDAPERLLVALESSLSEKDTLDRRLLQSADLFAQANTCAGSVLPQTEVIALANAFDRLLDSPGSALTVADAMDDAVREWGTVSAKSSARLQSRNVGVPPKYHDWLLCKCWIWELYTLRSAFTHGQDTSRNPTTGRPWAWDPHEHLLFGSYAFPLTMKVLLTRAGKYQLSHNDEAALGAIDTLLDTERWYDFGRAHGRFFEVLADARSKLNSRRLAEDLVRGFKDFKEGKPA